MITKYSVQIIGQIPIEISSKMFNFLVENTNFKISSNESEDANIRTIIFTSEEDFSHWQHVYELYKGKHHILDDEGQSLKYFLQVEDNAPISIPYAEFDFYKRNANFKVANNNVGSVYTNTLIATTENDYLHWKQVYDLSKERKSNVNKKENDSGCIVYIGMILGTLACSYLLKRFF